MADNNSLTARVIGCAIEGHRELGPGLLESTYQQCLSHELSSKGIAHAIEKPIPVVYKGSQIECGYRVDILVEDRLVLELKAVEALKDLHKAQLLTYMKLSKVPLGLLLNFNVLKLVDGIHRFRI